MKAELYIMRCKIDYLESLKDKLEYFLANRGICVVEKADTVMNVYVYEMSLVDSVELIGVITFDGVNKQMRSIEFNL